MNQDVNNLKVFLDQNDLETLFTEVKETVATDVNLEKENQSKNIFSAADLWRIQRLKSRTQRRSSLWN